MESVSRAIEYCLGHPREKRDAFAKWRGRGGVSPDKRFLMGQFPLP